MTNKQHTSFHLSIDINDSLFEKSPYDFWDAINDEIVKAIPDFRRFIMDNYHKRRNVIEQKDKDVTNNS